MRTYLSQLELRLLIRDYDFTPHSAVNDPRFLLGDAGLFREGQPVFDLLVHFADDVFSLLRLEVAEDSKPDEI